MQKKIFKPLDLIFSFILTSQFIISCGAELQSSSDVEAMFDNVLTLQNKMDIVCSEISSNNNFDKSLFAYGEEFCSKVPSNYVINLNSIASKEVQYGQNNGGKVKDGYFKYGLRVDLYANSGLIEAAQKAVPTLKDLQQSDTSSEFSISMIKKLELDETNISAYAEMEISSPHDKNGNGNIKNKWKLYGKKIDNYFLVTVNTTDSSTINRDTSLIHDAHILVAIIPHAGDIYLNLIGQFNLFDVGVSPAMSAELTKMITDTLFDIREKLN